jgi:hypothetical protein
MTYRHGRDGVHARVVEANKVFGANTRRVRTPSRVAGNRLVITLAPAVEPVDDGVALPGSFVIGQK